MALMMPYAPFTTEPMGGQKVHVSPSVRPVRRIFERGVTKLVMNTYFTLIMVKNHIITN